MPPNAQGPVQVRKPLTVPDTVNGHSVGRNGFHSNACRQAGGRRIFVQAYSGDVLGIELDRDDKIESVKKKVQAAFNIPTEQSTLVFGDHVLDKDLSAISSDAPVLLRKKISRSSSTPCLSPRSRDVHQNSVFEIVGGSKHSTKIKRLVREAAKGVEAGVQPVLATGGMGGAYYFRNCMGENVAIVKPTDEEPFARNNPKGYVGRALGQPGPKPSIRVGETGLREVAAYLLDHDHFAKVPVTALVNATHPIFNVNAEYAGAGHSQPGSAKLASFQQFIRHDFDASDYGPSRFTVSSVHRIGILDVRLFNTDRHAGNILVKKMNVENGSLFEEAVDLIPIDHGLCLPETLEDLYFEWLHWPQASIPFSKEELDYIEKLDPAKDCSLLRKELPTMREACLRMLVLCTIFLKLAAEAGLTLSEIGGMMTRELCGEEASELENVCELARMELLSSSPESDDFDGFNLAEDFSDDFQFDMDDHVEVPALKLPDIHRSPNSSSPANGCRSMSPLSSSPSWSPRFELSSQIGLSNFRALEISPIRPSPLDMSEKEWSLFLEGFQELLPEAFAEVKFKSKNQVQRLGTSCRF
ncbi:phosphatidylinositol 4-kinase gamma 6 isoform X2 [Physcomitrium patens]|uniref:1-phosphatidylinositol 4-kinase n=1 Tax=Physcomitrium patens TaxID=3218 RepID=A0A2K1KUK6_PHYPA|nr:phosphatidylinositol 4-kinase gamma 6-like isoform X2 [Physcomitrium patens]PNR57472.1 hypothetical protein PHYPA_004466 [Physcomitrium patens]|eukprot:XP_024370517.1 phosphatidylinositol 4-kinase gamma 6-like isoform X2 [Physcomitrella patens]